MNKTILATCLAMAVATPAFAATVINLDDTAHTLVVTEGGSQLDVPVGAGETVEICPSGCFVTLPNGDRAALTGTERLEIKDGRGRVF
ncbi:MAG TPA: hypothetical protein PL183_02680 [Aquamicrobium sp.]|nr:hypothetical protein [Aquamicrobium sp.]